MGERHFAEIDHEACVAFYAGGLSAEQASRARVYLEAHPDVARRAQLDAAHEHAVGRPYAGVLQEPIPRRLRVERAPAAIIWPRRIGVAAVIVVSGSVGWWLGNASGPADVGATFAARVASVAQQPAAAASAPADEARTIEVQAPDLSRRGYRLVEKRLLRDGARPLAEFVYRGGNGGRVRVYAEQQVPRGTPSPTVTSQDGISLAQWREGDTRYALVGNLPEMSLQALARSAAGGPRALAGIHLWDESPPGGLEGGMTAQQAAPVADRAIPAVSDDYSVRPSHM